MSWRERDYTWFPGGKRGYRDRTGTWREFVPPAATCMLLLLHVAGFIFVASTNAGRDGVPAFALFGGGFSWLGVVAHPIASPSALTALFVVSAVWTLGGRIESALGARTMLPLYLLGNLIGGLAYVAVAAVRPELALAPLMTPVGGLLAWTATAWRKLSYELVAVFVKEMPLAKVAAFLAAVAVVMVVLSAGLGAAAWVAAAAAGVAVPVALDAATGVSFRRTRRKAPSRVVPREAVVAADVESELDGSSPAAPEIDDILAKISRAGLSSLTADEKDRLEQARLARLRRGSEAPVR